MEALQEFVQKLAAFRKAHPVIRKAEPMHLNDYQHKGCPDLSYHSDNAWTAGLPEEKGAFGVMYCGDYAVDDAGRPDDMVYIGYNFHTGVNELALPKLAGKKKWYVVMDTAEQEYVFLPEEKLAESITVQAAEDKDCDEISAWAQKELARKYQVYAKRDKNYYERLLKELACEDGKLIIYRKDGQIVDVRPYYEESKETEEVEKKEAKPKIMIRIVDVRRMLMSLKLKSLMAVSFQITDPLIPENNRYVTMTGTEFSGLMLMDGKPETSEGILSVSALGELVFGAKTVEEISKEEGVSMSGRMASELEKIIPLSRIYLNETV